MSEKYSRNQEEVRDAKPRTKSTADGGRTKGVDLKKKGKINSYTRGSISRNFIGEKGGEEVDTSADTRIGQMKNSGEGVRGYRVTEQKKSEMSSGHFQ